MKGLCTTAPQKKRTLCSPSFGCGANLRKGITPIRTLSLRGRRHFDMVSAATAENWTIALATRTHSYQRETHRRNSPGRQPKTDHFQWRQGE